MSSSRRAAAAVAVGATLGTTAAAGTALLLYTGQGFLRAVGLLISSTIMAVAAGVWAGAPESPESPELRPAPVTTRARWIALILALISGGAFATLWSSQAAVRELALGGALAVLFILALPAYTAGALLAGLYAREQQDLHQSDGGGMAAASLAGAAFGILLTTTLLIQNIEPYGIYYGAAGLISLVSITEWPRNRHANTGITNMTNHVAIITGVGSNGQLGYAIAHRFLAAGARVLVTDISPAVEELGRQLAGGDPGAAADSAGHGAIAGEDVAVHGRVVAVRADLTSDDDIEHLFDVIRERFGRVDSLVNVAGGLSVIRAVSDTTPEEWQRELRRNAETVLRMSRAALPLLRESRGTIINFAAPAGQRAAANLGAYSAAKGAVIALTRALALEEKTNGVRVNAIAPGTMDTEQNRRDASDDDAAEFVSRDDVARVVLFLAGSESRGISGETIRVMGPTLS